MRKPRIGHLAFGSLCLLLGGGCRSALVVHSGSPAVPPEYVPVRDSENAFDGYALAAAHVEQTDAPQLTEVSFYPGQKKTAIAACDADVTAVAMAGTLPCEFKFVPRPPFHAPPHQAGWRLLGHVMRWKIDDACQKGNWDAAIDSAIVATRFGFDLTGGGPTDASLGLAIVDDARLAIVPYLAKMGAGQLQRLADGIGADLKRKPPISEAIRHEGENVKLAVETLESASDRDKFDEISHYLGSDVKEAVDYLQGIHGSEAKVAEYFRQFADEGAAHSRYLLEVASLPTARRVPPPKMKAKDRPWKHFARHFFTAADPLLQIDDRTVARTRLFILNAELIKGAKVSKSYPPNLSAFDPAYATDPYTGEKFRYRADPSEYVVYSVGENLRDDGGDTDESFSTPDLKLEIKE